MTTTAMIRKDKIDFIFSLLMLRSRRRNCWIITGCIIILVEVVVLVFEDVFNVFFGDDLLKNKGIISFRSEKIS